MNRRPFTAAAHATLVILFSGFLSVTVSQAQGTASASQQADSKTTEPVSPRLPRQAGDDVVKPLKNSVEPTDEKQTEAQAAYMAGVSAQKKGEFQEALKAFEQASKADPKAAAPVRARALLLMRLGRVRQAEEMASKAVELDPDDFETRLQLAVMISARINPSENRTRQLAEPLRLIKEALQSKRLSEKSLDLVKIHRVRGGLYLEAGDATKAAESYSLILDALEEPEAYGIDFREHQALMKDRVTGYETIGKVMLEIGRYEKAVTAFSALARVNEDTPGDYHFLLALTQYRKDDLKDAESNLNRYFETNRRSPESLQLLSDIYAASSRSIKIADRLGELAQDTNDADNVNMFLGNMLVEKGNGDEAAKVYKSIIDNSGNADAYIGLLRVDILKRDAQSLLKSVEKALRARIQRQELIPLAAFIVNDPDFGKAVVNAAVESARDSSVKHNPSATFLYSQIAQKLELLKQEGDLLAATLEQNPARVLGVEVLGRLGVNQLMQDMHVEASSTFRKLLTLPGLPGGERLMTLYRLSVAEAEGENFDGAIEAIRSAIEMSPENATLNYQLGLIQLQAKRFDDAEKTLRKTITFAENDPEREVDARLLLGGLYSQLERWDEAISTYNELLEMPGITKAATRRGRMALSNAYVQQGDMKNGESILEDVYEASPDDPGVNNDLGYLYAEQGKNLEKAEAMIRIAVEAEPDNPAYLDSLGWVLYRLEKYAEALDALEKATADPDYQDSTILEHLGDVQNALQKNEEASKSWNAALKIESESASANKEMVVRLKGKLESATKEAAVE